MSIVIVAFEGAPKVSEDAKKKEAELDATLEAKVEEILAQSEPPDAAVTPYVMHMLAVEDIDGLPPGGGLSAKRTTVEQILNKLLPPKTETEEVNSQNDDNKLVKD